MDHVHQIVRLWLAEAHAPDSGASLWWQCVPALCRDTRMQQALLPDRWHRRPLGLVDNLHQVVWQWLAEAQPHLHAAALRRQGVQTPG